MMKGWWVYVLIRALGLPAGNDLVAMGNRIPFSHGNTGDKEAPSLPMVLFQRNGFLVLEKDTPRVVGDTHTSRRKREIHSCKIYLLNAKKGR